MIHISNAAVSIHRCRRRSAPVRSGAPQFALRASAVVGYETWTCRNRVITLKFIIWFHLKCFRRTKQGNDIWYRENVLSYTKSSTRDTYGDRCIAPGLSITIFIFFVGGGRSVRSAPCYSAEFSPAFSAASASLKHWRQSGS